MWFKFLFNFVNITFWFELILTFFQILSRLIKFYFDLNLFRIFAKHIFFSFRFILVKIHFEISEWIWTFVTISFQIEIVSNFIKILFWCKCISNWNFFWYCKILFWFKFILNLYKNSISLISSKFFNFIKFYFKLNSFRIFATFFSDLMKFYSDLSTFDLHYYKNYRWNFFVI